jgi:ATP-binding cassette subfamily B protein
MNRMLGVQGPPPLRNQQNSYSSLSDILNLLRLSQADTNLASEFNQAFEIREFQLGEQLVNYYVPNSLRNFVQEEQDEPNNGWFYIVCQGRVRLLGLDAAQGRDVPALVVEAGESFGAEALFSQISELPVRSQPVLVLWLGFRSETSIFG